MTRTQLLQYIDQVFTSNGVGAITGPNGNSVLDAIVNSVYDYIEAITVPALDNKSVQLDGEGKLSVKVARIPENSAVGSQSVYAQVIDYIIKGTAWTKGLYVRVDGKTIGVDAQSRLCVLSGGGLPEVVSVFDDFAQPVIEAVTSKAHQSIDGTNGYMRLDTGAAVTTAYIIKTKEFDASGNPGFSAKGLLSTLTDSRIYIGLVDDIRSLSNASIGFYFRANDPSEDPYWHVVCGDGVALVDFTTTIVVDALEHTFSANYLDGIVTFLIDDVEVHAEECIIPSGVIRLSALLESTAAASKIAVFDYLTASQQKLSETGTVSFGASEEIVNYTEKRYICKITQTGVTNPVVDVFVHEFGVPLWARESVGRYTATLEGAFISKQTVPGSKVWKDASNNTFSLTYVDANSMVLTTKNSSDTLADGLLSSEDIEIKVYSIDSL